MDDIKLFVHHKNVIEINYANGTDVNNCIKEEINNPLFKVLKILNCSSIVDIANICNGEFGDALEKSSHWFIVDFDLLEVQEKQQIEISPILQRFDRLEKPLIFQIGIGREKLSFFKTELDKSFKFLDFNAHVDLIQHDFAKLVSKCIRRNHENFNGDLLSLKFDVNGIQSDEDVQLINEATIRNDILCLRFLLLSDWDLSKHNEIDERALEVAAGTPNGKPETLAAILDLPFDVNTEFLLLSEDRCNLLNLVDSDGKTILMLAAESGTLECVKYLLKCGAVVHHTRKFGEVEESAADLAYQANRLDILEILLIADSKFPSGFDMNKVNEKIKEIAKTRNELVDAIKNNLLGDVKKFCEENYKLKRMFNPTNEMALDVAITSGHLEIVAFLEQQGCYMSDYLDTEKASLQRKVQDELAKHFPQFADSHIHRLLSRTRFATSSQATTHKSEALKIFLKLNENTLTKSLMKVVQHHPNLDIIFDFNQRSTISLNPSSNLGTYGSTLFKIGRIYIGAKSEFPFPDMRDVVGTAAHEICHLVMQMLFSNSCQPYRMDDIESMIAFSRIVTDYYDARNSKTDDIVRGVFAYRPPLWPAELIVRYPHMIAFHDVTNHENIRKEFPELCSFYDETIQPKIDAFILHARDYKSQMMIAKLNKNLGHFDGTACVDVIEDALPDLNFDASTSVKIISTTQPNLVACLLKTKLQKANIASAVFATVNQIPQFHDELTMLHNIYEAQLVIACIGDRDQNYAIFFRSLQVNKKLILIQHPVFQMSNEKNNEIFRKNLISIDVKELKWANLTEATRIKISESTILFQGSSVKLNELLNSNFDGIEDLELDAFFRNEVIQAGEVLPLCVGYDSSRFIPRDFGTGESPIKAFSTENFGNAQLSRNVIIYGTAGMGKSTALSNIASQLKSLHPLHWIQLIDLKKYSDSFELLNFKGKEAMNLLIDEVLALKHKKIFRQLLNDDRVILLFDGFDELDDEAQENFVTLLNLLQETPVKQIWVTTRDEHLKTLTDELKDKCLPVTLKPLETSDQIKFIVGYWQTRVGREDQGRMGQLARTLVDKYEKCFDEKLGEFLGTLLQVRMLAEVFVPDK